MLILTYNVELAYVSRELTKNAIQAYKVYQMELERLYKPKELSSKVGLSLTQIRALMHNGLLEFVEVSGKTKLISARAWKDFQRKNTRNATLPHSSIAGNQESKMTSDWDEILEN